MNARGCLRMALSCVILMVLALGASVAFAQGPQTTTAMTIGVPSTAQLGQAVTLQARLADSAGHPIKGATIAFEIPTDFLGVSGNTVVAQGETNKDGVVMVKYKPTMSGKLTITADFKGDQDTAPAKASGPMSVGVIPSEAQLYVQQAGVPIPGLNEPMAVSRVMLSNQPRSGLTAALDSLWPTMSVWPLLLVLLIVWGLYGYAVTRIFALARQTGEERTAPSDVRGPRYFLDGVHADPLVSSKEK